MPEATHQCSPLYCFNAGQFSVSMLGHSCSFSISNLPSELDWPISFHYAEVITRCCWDLKGVDFQYLCKPVVTPTTISLKLEGSLRGKGHCKSNTKMFWLTAFILGNNASLTGLMRMKMKMMWIICYGLHSHQIMSDRALHHHHHQTLNEGISFRRMVFIPPVDFHRFEELIPRNTHVAVVLNLVSCVSVRRFFKSTHIKSLKELQ